ncbi:MAG: hypothetical protein ACTSYF_03620 [Promethearchaeota archaeon]
MINRLFKRCPFNQNDVFCLLYNEDNPDLSLCENCFDLCMLKKYHEFKRDLEKNEKITRKLIRYSLKVGKFGFYYFDNQTNQELSLEEVLRLLNILNIKFLMKN